MFSSCLHFHKESFDTNHYKYYRDNGHLTQAERNYNFVHSSTRMVIERAFGLLKACFRHLHFLEMDSLDDIAKVIVVAYTLHNVCLIGGRNTNATLKVPMK